MLALVHTRPKYEVKLLAAAQNLGSKKVRGVPVKVRVVQRNGWAADVFIHRTLAAITNECPKKMRQAALRSALSAKAADAAVVVVEDLKLDGPKTRMMASAIFSLVGNATALVLMPEKDQSYEVLMRSADNLDEAKVLLAGYLNIRDLLGYDKLVLPVKTLDTLVAHLG